MTTWLTSDWHLRHKKILDVARRGREFSCIEDHDAYIIDQTNKYVTKQDRLIVLGDVTGDKQWREGLPLLNKLVCRNRHLVIGNHDVNEVKKYFATVQQLWDITVGPDKLRLFLAHYPLCYWPASHYGSMHAYGHMHDQREKTLDACFPGRRSTDVGLDTARRLLGEMRPFSEHEIIDLLMSRPGHDPVEWYYEQDRLLEAQ